MKGRRRRSARKARRPRTEAMIPAKPSRSKARPRHSTTGRRTSPATANRKAARSGREMVVLTPIRIKTSQPAQIATATLAQAAPVIKLDTSRVTGRASGLVLARYRSAREVLFCGAPCGSGCASREPTDEAGWDPRSGGQAASKWKPLDVISHLSSMQCHVR